jgi:hypothetical protein
LAAVETVLQLDVVSVFAQKTYVSWDVAFMRVFSDFGPAQVAALAVDVQDTITVTALVLANHASLPLF